MLDDPGPHHLPDSNWQQRLPDRCLEVWIVNSANYYLPVSILAFKWQGIVFRGWLSFQRPWAQIQTLRKKKHGRAKKWPTHSWPYLKNIL